MIVYRVLTDEDFFELYHTALAAFSDYVVPYQPTQDALQRMYLINGVELTLSVGAFDGGKMVGFTVNGIGDWNRRPTAYDSGTGVIPEYRGRKISREMFEYILPILRENNVEQYLLEVITENEPAVRLYQSLDFEIMRRFSVYKRKEAAFIAGNPLEIVEIKEIETLDWQLLESFWTYHPSWQNSTDAIKRSFSNEKIIKIFLGLYLRETLIGYAVVFHNSGNIPQIAVAAEHRGKNFGRALLDALQKRCEKPLIVTNLDQRAEQAAAFFRSNGFSLFTTQYEMLLEL